MVVRLVSIGGVQRKNCGRNWGASSSPSILSTRTTTAIQCHPPFTSFFAFVVVAAAATLLNDLSYEHYGTLPPPNSALALALSLTSISPALPTLAACVTAEGAWLLVIEYRPNDEEEWSRQTEQRRTADDACRLREAGF
ncbi:hypothetical protein Nepgr_011672 [Nepenthes gracilis]|uniref:Uncharacterized protein n=1 Tax=Nepenthes gracilis TaxID=150966 RepID=A0AAD3SFK2_NEPGR|nr:hypothetical protein Nepgr_011672 [Nepenthes gracilis]